MSVVVRDLEPRHALLPLMAALAVCEAAEAVADVSCEIKWPNDVWIERRKVSGILVEGRPADGWAVLGIGLNVRRARVPAGAPRHRDDARPAEPRRRRSTPLLAALDRWLAAEPGEILAAWRAPRRPASARPSAGRTARASPRGIDDAGSLLVETAAGRGRRARSRRGPFGWNVALEHPLERRSRPRGYRPPPPSPADRPSASPAGAAVAASPSASPPVAAVRRRLRPVAAIRGLRLRAVGRRDRALRLGRLRIRVAAAPALLAPASRPLAPALGEVAQQLARQRGGLARHPHPRAVEHLLRLRRVGQRGRQQRRRQAAVLLLGRLHQPPRVARVGAARTSSPAARAAAWSPASATPRTPRAPRACTRPGARSSGGLVAAADRPLGHRLQQRLDALAALVALTSRRRSRPPRRTPPGPVIWPISCSARTRSCELRLRCRQVDEEAAAQLAGRVEVQHRLGAAPVVRRDARAGERRPGVLLAPREVLDGDPPKLALEDLRAPLRSSVTGSTRRSTRSRRPRPRRTGPTTIAPPR